MGRLSRLERAHSQEIAALGRRHRTLVDQATTASGTLAALAPLADRVAQCDPQAQWRMEISGATFDNRGEAARALDRHLPRYGVARPLSFVDAKVEYAWGGDRPATNPAGWSC